MAYSMHRRKVLRSSSAPALTRRQKKVVSPTVVAKAAALSPDFPVREAKPWARNPPKRNAVVGSRCRTATLAAAPAPRPRATRRCLAVAPVLAALPTSAAHAGGAATATAAAAAAAATGSDGALTVVTKLVVPYRPTSHGQQLVLVGNCEALGNWDPKKGVRFTWCEGHSHIAETELPIHTDMACKLVVLGDNGSAVWEPDVDRELLLAPSSLAGRAAGYTLLCHWGFPTYTQFLPNSLRRGASGSAGGSGTAAGAARGGRASSGSGHHTRPAASGGDNPIIAGVKRALAHASGNRERFAVIPGVASSWEEEGASEAAAEAEEDESLVAQCQVTVLVPPSGPKLKPEQSLVLVGSSTALGRWDPANGLPLERAGEESPMWSAQAELPLGEGLLAKVVVVDSVSGEAQIWEPCENRSLARHLGATRPVLITAYWGAAPTHCMEVDRLAAGAAAGAASSPQVVQLLRQQLAATSTQLDGLRRERDEARKAVAAGEEHVRKLEVEVKTLDRGHGRLELVQLADQLQTTRRLYETTKREAAQLGGTMGVTRQLCDAAKRELAGLAAQLEAARAAYDALAPQVEIMERQLASTHRAFEATKPELRALEVQLDRARSMFDRTLQKIEAAKALTAAAADVDPAAMAAAAAAAARRRSVGESAATPRVREVQYARHF
ncbi:hypothetical protein PLESTB_000564800 [Pleodorina starrii]|uniref:CBM20 domain-containing protein n=1 Tax=Pleodorina starrii TaxID=330485 RepID=A0A9W6BHY9_9CHLO|nr:hypothetical protein PLESTM_000289800 [Pleodorina starrii]GLC51937.1 hypothetical protein PLESTB_000564800 [Pleodorina starrii]GLC68514.1 hypothetical protein PLESTF_000700500 [Pleodorina starrii]